MITTVCKHCRKEIIAVIMFVESPPIWYHKETNIKYCNPTKAAPLEDGDANE